MELTFSVEELQDIKKVLEDNTHILIHAVRSGVYTLETIKTMSERAGRYTAIVEKIKGSHGGKE